MVVSCCAALAAAAGISEPAAPGSSAEAVQVIPAADALRPRCLPAAYMFADLRQSWRAHSKAPHRAMRIAPFECALLVPDILLGPGSTFLVGYVLVFFLVLCTSVWS